MIHPDAGRREMAMGPREHDWGNYDQQTEIDVYSGSP